MHLTDIAIKALKVENGQRDFADDAIPGLALRVGKRAKTFTLVMGAGANRRRIKIGRYPDLKLAAARSKAKALIGEQQGQRDQSTVVFQTAFDRFIELHLKTKNKPSSAAETERLIRRHLVPTLGKIRLEAITKREVAEIIDSLISTPAECAHAFTAGRTFFRFCEKRGYLSRSPMVGLEAPTRNGSRDRVLSDEEIKKVAVKAATTGQYGALIMLLLLTGQRSGQIAALRGEFIDFEAQTITWPAALMKGNRIHTIPYGKATASLLETLPKKGLLFPTVKGQTFNNWSNCHSDFLEKSKVQHFTRHDLRRTYSTGMARLGVPQHVTELLLDHRSGATISPVAAIYNRYNYESEMRAAVEKWEQHVSALQSKHGRQAA